MFSAICNCWEVHNAFIYNASFSDQPNIEFEVHPEIGHIYSEIQSVQTAMALGRLPVSFRHCVEKFTLDRLQKLKICFRTKKAGDYSDSTND